MNEIRTGSSPRTRRILRVLAVQSAVVLAMALWFMLGDASDLVLVGFALALAATSVASFLVLRKGPSQAAAPAEASGTWTWRWVFFGLRLSALFAFAIGAALSSPVVATIAGAVFLVAFIAQGIFEGARERNLIERIWWWLFAAFMGSAGLAWALQESAWWWAAGGALLLMFVARVGRLILALRQRDQSS
jgi:hypothetical protein